MKHEFYKTGDANAPSVIKDGRGEVVLQMCKHCRMAEGEIKDDNEDCPALIKNKMKKAHDILREAALTYEERNAVYGDNYIRVGAVMQAHFPDGLFVHSSDDWNRLHIFILGVVKDTRYVTNWNVGGHGDSSRDRTVYSAMLEEIDTEIGARESKPIPINLRIRKGESESEHIQRIIKYVMENRK